MMTVRSVLEPVIRPVIGAGSAVDGPTLGINFTTGVFDPRITFARTSTATLTNSAGVLESVAANVPRFDFNPVTLACEGLLVEGPRTNLLTYSEQFDNAAWTLNGATVTPNTTVAPNGTTTADTISSPNGLGVFQSVVATIATIYTNSIFVKAGTATELLFRDDAGVGRHLVINPVTGAITSTSGTIISSGVKAYPNGWYRYHMTYATDSTAARGQVRNNLAGTVTFAQWGAQIELGDAPTSYIPTVDSQVTRTADDATMTGTNLSDWYNPSQGTFVLEGEYSHIATGVPTMLRLDDGTENERLLFRIESGTQRFSVIDVGSSQADISRPGVIAGVPFRQAAASLFQRGVSLKRSA